MCVLGKKFLFNFTSCHRRCKSLLGKAKRIVLVEVFEERGLVEDFVNAFTANGMPGPLNRSLLLITPALQTVLEAEQFAEAGLPDIHVANTVRYSAHPLSSVCPPSLLHLPTLSAPSRRPV